MIPRFAIIQSIVGAFRGRSDDPGSQERANARKQIAGDMARRWTAAMRQNPKLREDLINMGGLFVLPPIDMIDGEPSRVDMTPYACGREAGRRELATQLLALGGVTVDELNSLMEMEDDI